VDLLEEYETEKLAGKATLGTSAGSDVAFAQMTIVQRIKAVDAIVDSDIRQMLPRSVFWLCKF